MQAINTSQINPHEKFNIKNKNSDDVIPSKNFSNNVEKFLNLNIPNNSKVDLGVDQQNIVNNVVETLKKYYNDPPSEKILPYLFLNFINFSDLKNKIPLKIDVKFYEDADGSGRNSIECQYMNGTFGLGTQKNYILNIAYQEAYFNFYTDADRKKLSEYLSEYGKDVEEKTDVCCRVVIMQGITKKYPDFPFSDLVYSLGLFYEKK
jgi:hypothetical protein